MGDIEVAPSPEEWAELDQQIDTLLRRRGRIACFTQESFVFPPGMSMIDVEVGFHSLGIPGYAHDRMWAQYADNHKGVCLVFDRAKLVERMQNHFGERLRAGKGVLIHGPVEYIHDQLYYPSRSLSHDELHQMGVEDYVKSHRERFARQLYLTKTGDWANEQEYRFVWIDGEDREDPEFVSIEGCLAEICTGARFPEPYHVNMRQVMERLGIEVHAVRSWNGRLNKYPMFYEPPPPPAPTVVPDDSFGCGGTVTTHILDSAEAHCVLAQSDGKVVVAGGAATRLKNQFLREEGFAIARYEIDGTLDATFGQEGTAVAYFAKLDRGAQALVLRKGGELIAMGTARVEEMGVFALASFKHDGELDDSFGEGGIVTSDFGRRATAQALALQSDGGIIIGGKAPAELPAYAGAQWEPLSTGFKGGVWASIITRYRENGQRDEHFGDGGVVVVPFLGPWTWGLTIQPDDKILLAGTYGRGAAIGIAVARFTPDGEPDTSFGRGGWQAVEGLASGQDRANGIVLQPDGKLIVIGHCSAGDSSRPSSSFAAVRLHPDGSPDEDFGEGGTVVTAFGDEENARAHSAIVRPDGRIICGGYASGLATLVYYTAEGIPDDTFGDRGVGRTSLRWSNGVEALALRSDGKVVAIGTTSGEPGSEFALACFP